MIKIELWMKSFLEVLDETFGDRVWFVGLQGSYARGEATDSSDIDVVVIFDEVSCADIVIYHDMLEHLPHRELICGFLSGKDEITNWVASDLFQFYHDTIAIKGSLDELLCRIDGAAVDSAIKIGACNIYHGCVHNMLHERNEEILSGLYKSASFMMQAIYFKQTGKYIRSQKELVSALVGKDKYIIETFLKFKHDETPDFEEASKLLFEWSKRLIKE